MAKEKLTPEDKLLKIIENPTLGPKKMRPKVAVTLPTSQNLVAWFESLWKERKIFELLRLAVLNRILIAVCVIATIFLLVDFQKHRFYYQKSFLDIEAGTATVEPIENALPSFSSSIEESLAHADTRDVFSFAAPKKETKKTSTAQEQTTIEVSQELTNLKLVAIIWSETNPQVMIEDRRQEKTSLLGVGDALGVVKVKKIYIDKVMLEIDGKEWELR